MYNVFKKCLPKINYLQNIRFGLRNLTSKTMDIQNFVFFDTETTGLPHEEYNKTRITEMCFVVVQKEHICLGVYPRVQNKLTFCFNPNKMINPMSSQITGLTNDLLEFQSHFGPDTCDIINKFLGLQKKPICLVAHNGNRFDYPIFKAELHRAGCDLIDNILCIDSLQMFRDLDIEKAITPEQSSPSQTSYIERKAEAIHQRNIEVDIHNLPTQKNIPIELCDEFDELLFNVVDGVEMSAIKGQKVEHLNENTPKKVDLRKSLNQNYKIVNALQDHLYYTPPNDDRSNNTSTSAYSLHDNVKAQSTARRKLNFGTQSYKLSDVYNRLTKKKNENAHLADQDVSMLVECAATLGQDFVDWANANAKRFSDIPMMKPGVKLGL